MQTTVSPTFWEAFHYANLSGQWPWTIIGAILLGAFLYFWWRIKNNRTTQSSGTVFIMVVLVASSLGCFLGKPLAIRWSNDKTVPAEYLQKVGKKYILDSVYYDNRMINAAVKK